MDWKSSCRWFKSAPGHHKNQTSIWFLYFKLLIYNLYPPKYTPCTSRTPTIYDYLKVGLFIMPDPFTAHVCRHHFEWSINLIKSELAFSKGRNSSHQLLFKFNWIAFRITALSVRYLLAPSPPWALRMLERRLRNWNAKSSWAVILLVRSIRRHTAQRYESSSIRYICRTARTSIVILMETKAYSCVIWSHGLDQSEWMRLANWWYALGLTTYWTKATQRLL